MDRKEMKAYTFNYLRYENLKINDKVIFYGINYFVDTIWRADGIIELISTNGHELTIKIIK